MNSTNYIGFFQQRTVLLKAENSLKIAGFRPQNIIIQASDEHPLMLSVVLNDDYDRQMAANIFKFYGVTHIDEINGQIDNAEELRRIISIHSRQQIYSPKGSGVHKHFHEGMNAEIQSFQND